MAYAHFFTKTARKPAEVIITSGPELNAGYVALYCVGGKTEARRFAKQHNAVCWNF
jgi:hypothetical protein